MNKEIIKNCDEYWLDEDGNSLVVAENGSVYIVTEDEEIIYITDDIRKIYDEEKDDYLIDGMTVSEYIRSAKKPAETLSVWTSTAKNTEPVVTSRSVQETNSEVTEIPARVIYQTIYKAPETEIIFSGTEKTEVSKIEKSEKEETDGQEFSESELVTTVPEEYVSAEHEAEEFQSGSSVYSEAAVTTIPQEKILYFTENSSAANNNISAVNSEINISENTETTAVAVIEDTAENISPANNIQAFALVTSKFTMDKLNEKARRYLAERCDLLGAVRLPAGTFKDADSVTSDILFLKKRETMTVEIPDWVHMSETADGIPCNKYFVDNPEMVLGKMAWDERMKGKYGDDSKVTVCVADNSIPLSEQLKNAISKIEGKIETVKEKSQENNNIKIIPADPSVRNFTHTLVDGKLYFRENEIMTEVAETGKTLDRMLGMHKIRQAAMAVIDAQAADCSDEELQKLQSELNFVYDKFKRNYGNITDAMNERCFRHDDDYYTLAALEIVNTEKKTVEKSEIFSKRTIQPEKEITSVDTPQEALQVSIDRIGKVDIEYMASLAGTSPEKIISSLDGEIFRNPAKIKDSQPYSGYEDAAEYLSGNVREKLKIAENYAKHIDSGFQKNADALKKVIPKNLEAGEISVRIGANWIDVEDYNNFFHEYAKADMDFHPVVRTRMGEYKIEGKYQDRSVAANNTYGTGRMSSYHIFENLLNQRDIVVRDRREEDGKVWYEVNAKETQLAKEKARQMKEGFKNWIWQDIDRREKYVLKYNYLFNAIRGREYDGSHQTFPGRDTVYL